MSEEAIPRRRPDWGRIMLFLLLAGTLYLVFRIILPYLNSMILAILLAILFRPVYSWFLRITKNKRNLAAFLACTVIVLLVVVPVSLLVASLVDQGITSFTAIQSWLQEGNLQKTIESPRVQKMFEWGSQKFDFVDFESIDLQATLIDASKNVGQFLLSKGSTIASDISAVFLHFFMMIFILYYLLRDGERMLDYLLHLSPMSSTHEEQLLNKIREVSRAALLGNFLTALSQGIAGGIGLWIAGIPPLFWGTVMAFASLIPLVGTALVWFPASIYLLITGHTLKAVFLAVYSMIVVGSIDNFLRPYFMQGRSGLPPILLFFAILGGINLFGLLGIIYGPLIFGLAAVLLYIYELEFSPYLTGQDKK